MYTEYAFHCNCFLPFPFRTEPLSLIHSCFVSPAGDEIPCKGDIVDGGHGHQFLRGPGWIPLKANKSLVIYSSPTNTDLIFLDAKPGLFMGRIEKRTEWSSLVAFTGI